MKRRLRLSKAVLRSSAVATVLLVAIWIMEIWYGVFLMAPGGYFVGAGEGLVGFGIARSIGKQIGLNIESSQLRLWWFEWEYTATEKIIAAPIWLVLLLSMSTLFISWRIERTARRREVSGLCLKCGYDRSGLAQSTRCPECGEVGGIGTTDRPGERVECATRQ